MKVLVFSDSHGNADNMIKVAGAIKDADIIIHLGDLVKDAVKLGSIPNAPKMECVAGNNDWYTDYPDEKIISVSGKQVLITHGHNYGVKRDRLKLVLRAQETGADLILFGHTHIPEEFYENGKMFLNPGSIGSPVCGHKPSYAVIEITRDYIHTNIIMYNNT